MIRRHDDPGDFDSRPVRNGSLKVPLIIIVAFLLTLMGTVGGLLNARVNTLDERKADKETVAEIRSDVRELRNFFLGPKR